jgi:peptide/nickel transport system substrate-binding protein
MKNKILGILLCCAMLATLILVSCGEKTTTTTTTTTAAVMPKYGGTFNVIGNQDITNFDDLFQWTCGCLSVQVTNEELMGPDWAKGPAGTGAMSFEMTNGFDNMGRFNTQGLAESWNLDANTNTITLKIRKGVYWQNKAPTNGRELVADDVVYSINRAWSAPSSFLKASYSAPESVTAPDKYTVLVKYPTFILMTNTFQELCEMMAIWPRDAGEEFGDFQNWRNSIGTGPFVLTDYVKGSTASLVRNTNYWDTDPIGAGKGNKLPYLDKLDILIITDKSTRLSAIRTGKADLGYQFSWEDAASMKQTNPDVLIAGHIISTPTIHMREDNPDFPWCKLAVRQAMAMGIDYQKILDTFYGGEGTILSLPSLPNVEYQDFYTPFKDLPADVQALYTYQPEKAAQMIKDAGYPTGFTMEVICNQTHVDLLSIYKDMWSQIGVTLEIKVVEMSVYMPYLFAGTYKNAFCGPAFNSIMFNMDLYRDPTTHPFNGSKIVDARCEQAYQDIWANYMDWNKRCQLFKELTPYILRNCWYINTPAYKEYAFWQPWVSGPNGYHGELCGGNCDYPDIAKWVWIDESKR